MNIYVTKLENLIDENRWVALAATLLLSIALALVIKLILKLLSKYIRPTVDSTEVHWLTIAADIIDGLKWPVVTVWNIYLLDDVFPGSKIPARPLAIAFVSVTVFQIVLWGLYIIKNLRSTELTRRLKSDPSSTALVGLIFKGLNAAFIAIAILIGLSNLGIDVGALLAGLGIGGIAVALAAQNVLGDLLASLSIVLDKPFLVGDFIVADDESGTIEQIGLKTTRVRTLSGEELIWPNKALIESKIHNYKRMQVRRIVQRFALPFQTPIKYLESIPEWVGDIAKQDSRIQFDRCHFANYGSAAYEFELVFIVLDADFNVYMNLQQKILFGILRKLADNGLQFALSEQKIVLTRPS